MKRRDLLIASAGLASSLLPGLGRAQARPCPPPTFGVQGGQSQSTTCVAGNAEADWLLRTGQNAANPQPGVVWFHDFRTDAEVNNFRWTPGFGGGNDPNAVGNARAGWCRRLATGGLGGMGCLELFRAAGSSEGSEWWRPLSPLTAPGNGKSTNDPGANGTLPAQSYSATSGGSQINGWTGGSRPGWYGHSSYHSGTLFDGTEFYLQMRVKMDPRRTTAGNTQVGKLFDLATTIGTNINQKIVTYSGAFPVSGVGQPNYHRIYATGASAPIEDLDSVNRPGSQVGSELANYGAGQYCDINTAGLRQYCWAYSGGWDTLLYHMTPGRSGVEETRLVVYAAHEGVTTYTKILDVTYATSFEAGSSYRNGWNGLDLFAYQNGQTNSEFWQRYAQIIFSKQLIPCPQV